MTFETYTPSQVEQVKVFDEALRIMGERDKERSGVWARSGVKGQVFHCYAKAERAFTEVMRGNVPNRDHFLDLINYSAFAIRLGDNLNGDWPWSE